MKLNSLIKGLPLIFTLLLITLLGINNQNKYTKLKIIIWNTPSMALGNYLAISTGTGFIISYFITTNLARIYQIKPHDSLKSKENYIHDELNEYSVTDTNLAYDNTLIERDVKDPSPTINASFRIIGRKEGTNINKNIYDQYVDSSEFDESYDEKPYNSKSSNSETIISSDWNDESYSRW